MNSFCRRLAGLTITLIMVPVLIGLLACIPMMPVPIGDAERSRVDPVITGTWLWVGNGSPFVLVIQPYDKRTWTVWAAMQWDLPEDLSADHDVITKAKVMARIGDTRPDKTDMDDEVLFKAWTVKLGGRHFMTWEPLFSAINPRDFQADEWLVFRVDRIDDNRFDLVWVAPHEDLVKGLPETRRAYEKMIRKNVDNPQLYGLETDEAPDRIRLFRLTPDEIDRFMNAAPDGQLDE